MGQIAASDVFQLRDGLIQRTQNDHPQREPGQHRQQHAEQARHHDQRDLGTGIAFRVIHLLRAELHGEAAEIAEILFKRDAQRGDSRFLNMIILIDFAGLDGGSHRLHALIQIGAVAVLQAVGEFAAALGHGADADKARHFLVRLLEVTVDAAHGGVGDISLADLPLAHRQRGGGSGAQRQVGAVGQRAQLFAEDLV